MTMETCDVKVIINGHHTFFLNKSMLCPKLKQLAAQKEEEEEEIKLDNFPGGPTGFELVSRFCYSSNGSMMMMSPSTVCLIHSSATALSIPSLIHQSEAFLDGLFYWTWDDLLVALTTCPSSSPLLPTHLIPSLLSKIQSHHATSSSSPSSPYSATTSSPTSSSSSPLSKDWWFDDLTALPPATINSIFASPEGDNSNLTLTRFLLHYLKRATRRRKWKRECNALADSAVRGVVSVVGTGAFSCRGLFWVMRVVSGFGISGESRQALEGVIGMVLDRATLDDLLVSSGREGGGVYDVNLVVRLVRVFVAGVEEVGGGIRLRKVGRLLDKYLREISPDQGLKVPKFLAVAESLPDSARDCFDGVYRALDIYLESHPTLSSEERATLCRCLNYEKLTLETCKDLAKNPRIPPGVAMQALVSQKSKLDISSDTADSVHSSRTPRSVAAASTTEDEADTASTRSSEDKDELKNNLQKMQSRVKELEKVCFEMKSQMSNILKGKPIVARSGYQSRRGMTRFC